MIRAQTPLALLPEFSDSRDEPSGPAIIAPPPLVEFSYSVGIYYLVLLLLGTAWSSRDFRAFREWQDRTMRSGDIASDP